MITIAGGIILAILILAFAGPIIGLIAGLGYLFFIGAIIFGIGIVIYLNADFLVPIILFGSIIFIFFAIFKSIGKKVDDKFSKEISNSNYTDAYVKVYLKYRFLRFSNQSKIDYYKNLEKEKKKINKRIEEENQKQLEYANKRKIREQEAEYKKRIKQFSKLTNDLKKLENKINTNNAFNFTYSEVSANIALTNDTKPSKRAHSLEFGYDKKTNIDGYQFSVVGSGNDFKGKYSGTKKEVLNWTVEELGKILAELEAIK